MLHNANKFQAISGADEKAVFVSFETAPNRHQK
jgi:hypothetical protein